MLLAPQGPEPWPEESSGDQELAAVLVSWTGPLTAGRSHAPECSLPLQFQRIHAFFHLNLEGPSGPSSPLFLPH